MGIVGSRVGDKNIRYRFLFIAFTAIMAFAIIVSWRGQLMMNSEYQDVTMHRTPKRQTQTETKHKTPLQEELEAQ